MAKKTAKKSTRKTSKKAGATAPRGKSASGRGPGKGLGYKAGDATGKDLVIVESPAKAKTINRYLGDKYVVLASVGHVRDLPSKAPKGSKQPVPGVDLEKRFTPSYEVMSGKDAVVKDLKRAAKDVAKGGGEVWFATDLDREGEAIAWHLAQELGVEPKTAKRVIFPAITKSEISKAFQKPHAIDLDRVNAQQARRILDRIVGYQVSPLLWKKVARGLSAGRVQSVAVRLIVEREREIMAFVPDEYWAITANFALSEVDAGEHAAAWAGFLAETDERGNAPTLKSQNAWLADRGAIKADLVELDGQKFEIRSESEDEDLTDRVVAVAEAAGLTGIETGVERDEHGRGPARFRRTVTGTVDVTTPYRVTKIETKRTTSRPAPPLITSTLQQQSSNRLGMAAQRTMRAAQGLYEGIELPGEGPVGLITYMRTDSTHVAPEAVQSARNFITDQFGPDYLPDKPNAYSSSNKGAQEAHEAIRPTSMAYPPEKVKRALRDDQFKVYKLIWDRFVASQMTSAKWDSTGVTIEGGRGATLAFRATGRKLVFDGFYRVMGVPTASDEQTLPAIEEQQPLSPFALDALQKFTSPPPRYTEASLIKTLESEGIGRPSTYASIIQVVQDRKYVEQLERRFHATDLGMVVTDKLVEAFPEIMDVGYTRDMEGQLDKVEDEHLDWIDMLERFYGPFKRALAEAEENLKHAKAEIQPAPDEYRCQKCGSTLVYRFGKNGRFLSCSTYPECNYACPCDRDGKPRPAEFVNVRCPKTGRPMTKKTGRFGPFITTLLEDGESNDVGMILNIDKKGFVVAPSPPPLLTDLECEKDGGKLNLRDGVRGPWLGCSNFPKCRGRGKWAELPDKQKAGLEAALEKHMAEHPIPIIETLDGRALTDSKGKPAKDAPPVDQLLIEDPADVATSSVG
ncbi:MAG: DNA topoisomerase [Planctomycetota bacterium]